MNIKYQSISLFSGAFGLDLGLESVGIKTMVAVEKNPIAVKTIKLNKGQDFPAIDKPIEEVSTSEILEMGDLKPGEAFVLTGGPCCQSFSTAGKRQSLSDVGRGMLFKHFKRIVSEAKPRFFVMENVKGMLSAAVRHRPLDERGPGFPPLAADEELGSALKVIREELASLQYYVIFGLVNCADYGVPQKRHRVIFVGSRDAENIVVPPATHSKHGMRGTIKWVTLEDAIKGLKTLKQEWLTFADDRIKLLSQLESGQNWTDLPKRFHRTALGAAADTWGGRSGFCRRLAWNEPAPTLTTDPTGRATTLCHPNELRPLSVKEYAKLQQFPDNWKFAGSTAQKYVQIGNAVPIGLGAAIGDMLLKVSKEVEKRGEEAIETSRLGKVVCLDAVLDKRIRNRPKTQLHPAWKRKNSDPEATRKWLSSVAV
jgi:DNA (cytosine-5)-methyltransferase 1